jgi:hypothetical protein
VPFRVTELEEIVAEISDSSDQNRDATISRTSPCFIFQLEQTAFCPQKPLYQHTEYPYSKLTILQQLIFLTRDKL